MIRFVGMSLIFVCGGLLASCGSCSVPGGNGESTPSHRSAEPACEVVGAIPYWAQDRAVESFRRHIELIDSVYVFWYNLDRDGKIRKFQSASEDKELIDFAHQHGVEVFALVANLPDDEQSGDGGDWDPERVGQVIGSSEKRAAHIADLMALTERMSFDGLVIDYEALPGTYRENFTLFVKELAAALHAKDKLLAVTLHPKTSENNPAESNGAHAQDWDALHEHADQLHFMIYSEHTASTKPGPVASFGWLERVLRYAVADREVPLAKIYMGLPLYAEEWRARSEGGYEGLDVDLTFEDAQARKRKHNGTQLWSAKYQSPYIRYKDDEGTKHVIWFEDKQSSERKLRLGAELGVCNIFLWRLGGEDPGLWELLRNKEYKRHLGRGHDPEHDPEHKKTGSDQKATDSGDTGIEGDGNTDSPAAEDGPLSWRLWGASRDGYPRLEGEAGAEVEYYSKFAAADPEDKHHNWLTNIHIDQVFSITSRLAVKSRLRTVLESDGEDPRFHSDFPYEGIYVRTLWLSYETDSFAVFGGKYDLAAGLFGRAPIFFGNYSTDLKRDRRVGVGASATLTRSWIGRHTLSGHSFYLDTSALSGEVFTGQGRKLRSEGGAANTGRPESFLVTLDGASPDSTDSKITLHYTLGGGLQKGGEPRLLDQSSLSEGALGEGVRDEHIYLGALYGTIALGGHSELMLSVDLLWLGNAGSEAVDTQSIGLGMAYAREPFQIGAAYSTRFVNPHDQTDQRTDLIAEIVARYDLGRALLMEAAYQHIRESGSADSSFGIVLRYMADWLIH